MFLYHSSPKKFNSFRPISHFGTLKAASDRTNCYQNDNEESYLYKCNIDLGNCIEIMDYGNETDMFHDDLYRQKIITKEEFKYLNSITDHIKRLSELAIIIQSKNIDSFKYINEAEDVGNYSYIITNSEQVDIVGVK